MSAQEVITMVGADEYFIEQVGGECWVGAGKRHHSHGRGTRGYYPGFYAEPLIVTYGVDEEGHLARIPDDDTNYYKRVGARVAGYKAHGLPMVSGFFDAAYAPESVGGVENSTGIMNLGDVMHRGDSIRSPNRRAHLLFQNDGNVVLHGAKPMWNTQTAGSDAAELRLNRDGTFVLYDSKGHPVGKGPPCCLGGHTLRVQDDGNLVLYSKDMRPLWHTNTQGFAIRVTHNVAADIVHDVGAAAKAAGKAISKIPVLGTIIQATIKLDPIHVIGGLAAKVLSGERLDKAFLETGKQVVSGIKDVAPYVKAVVSFVPGVGTGIAAAIAAGTALAEGKSITDALADSVIAAVPGGSLGQTAARGVLSIAKGERLDTVAVNALKSQLPASVGPAIDTALKVAQGNDVKGAVLQAIRANLPADAQKAVDIATALGAARNIQASTVQTVTSPSAQAVIAKVGEKTIAASPALARKAPTMPEPKRGYQVAAGLLAHTGVTPHALVAARESLKPTEQAGFDAAIKTVNDLNNPNWKSLVVNGTVYRGDWRRSAANMNGATRGHLVSGNQVEAGWYARSV